MDPESFVEACTDVLVTCSSDDAVVSAACAALSVLCNRSEALAHTALHSGAMSKLSNAMRAHNADTALVDAASSAMASLCSNMTSGFADGLVEAANTGSACSAKGASSGSIMDIHLPSAGHVQLRELAFTTAGLGWKAWSASLMLARMLERSASSLHSCAVLELGAGLGLPGIVASIACTPQQVVLSDRSPSIVLTLEENIANNTAHSRTRARLFDWQWALDADERAPKPAPSSVTEGCTPLLLDQQSGAFDAIIGAEVAWNVEQPAPFAAAVASQLKNCTSSFGWFVCACRGNVVDQLMHELSTRGLRVEWQWVRAISLLSSNSLLHFLHATRPFDHQTATPWDCPELQFSCHATRVSNTKTLTHCRSFLSSVCRHHKISWTR